MRTSPRSWRAGVRGGACRSSLHRAAAALALLCAATASGAPARPSPASSVEADELLARAVARFRARDDAEAATLFGLVRRARPADADVALLLGIALHRLDRDDDAAPHLRAAATLPGATEETRASARLVLGVIAADRGDDDAARLHLGAVESGGPSLAATSRLARDRACPPRLAVTLLVRPGFDSNVPLLPLTPALAGAGAQADADLLLIGMLGVRPLARLGLVLEALVSYRHELRLGDFDLFVAATGAQYEWRGDDDRVFARYAFEGALLGGVPYSIGHLLDTAYRRRLWRQLGLEGRYELRYRSYLPDGYAPFSGAAHAGALLLSWGAPGRPLLVEVGGVVVREGAADPIFSATGGGGRARARVRIARGVSFELAAAAIHRRFDRADPVVGPRTDDQLAADLAVSIDLTSSVGLVAGGSLLRNLSTVADYDYLKVTAWAGVAAGWGWL